MLFLSRLLKEKENTLERHTVTKMSANACLLFPTSSGPTALAAKQVKESQVQAVPVMRLKKGLLPFEGEHQGLGNESEESKSKGTKCGDEGNIKRSCDPRVQSRAIKALGEQQLRNSSQFLDTHRPLGKNLNASSERKANKAAQNGTCYRVNVLTC